uniref:Uncharacterized protein n=1 Tax=Candidatus Kentrum sp. LPFa TaxID=2126335 RepID=A0A450WEH2_9GAMM|nr:MAG: hypothetical protein BECKLPF1236B_GA0070989_107711 [Candidatus Kentron sp. LPFa]
MKSKFLIAGWIGLGVALGLCFSILAAWWLAVPHPDFHLALPLEDWPWTLLSALGAAPSP